MSADNDPGRLNEPQKGEKRKLPLSPLEKLVHKFGSDNVRLTIEPTAKGSATLQEIEVRESDGGWKVFIPDESEDSAL